MPTPYINTFYPTGNVYYVGYSDSTYVYIQQDGCQLYLTSNPDVANLYDVSQNLYVLDITLITTPVVASISELISLTPTTTTTITSGEITSALGYTPESTLDKTDLMSGNTTSSIKYLSAKGVYDWVIAQAYLTASSLTGYATQSWVNAQGFITNVVTSLGYTPEDSANKSSSYTISSTTTYANTKALVDGLATKQNTLTNPVTGTGTSNEIAYFNGGGTIASLTTGTYPSLTELSYVKGATSAIQTQVDTKLTATQYKSTTNSTAVTGTTANTLASSVLISANTFSVGNIVHILTRSIKTGSVGTMTLRIYVNTTSSISGATLIGSYPSLTSSNLYLQIERYLMIKTTTNTQTASATGTLLSDTAVTSALSTLNIDWSINQYIIFALQNSNNSDSTLISGYRIIET